MKVNITEEDIAAARLTGATGIHVLERALNRAVDRDGIPHEGWVTLSRETMGVKLRPGYLWEIELPPGYRIGEEEV
jgi:hypothetical protein